MVLITPATRGQSAPMPTTASKPLPRRPTLSGKVRTRDEADMDDDIDMMSQSPGKKAKVTFDPDVQVQFTDNWEKGPELIREELRRAIERHHLGDSAAYDQTIEIFTTEPTAADAPSPLTLKNHILALTSSVSLLDRSCSGLVHAILDTQWLGREDTFVSSYVRFLGNLVSAQGGYVPAVLSMLVGKLIDRTCNPYLLLKAKYSYFYSPHLDWPST